MQIKPVRMITKVLYPNKLDTLVANPLRINEHRVFECEDATPISYSDGRDSERYLLDTFAACSDLRCDSPELQSCIRDWPSEYHLSWRRSQLFSCFEFNRSARVLEVGCGCGAITRFLGENFDMVVSVEGAKARAEVARKRCADLDSVSIICAPFQEIRFTEKFDLIFCIGVFEYSRAFVDGADPYTAITEYFASQLSDNGQLVLAIENQFGLKYFASASEDHTGVPYDGIEGYHRRDRKARTFGKNELGTYLQPYFPHLEWFYPFPDYKLPDAVYAEKLLSHIDISPLLAAHRSRDFLRPFRSRFDERLAWRDICRNSYLPNFSHSFLVLASRSVDKPWATRSDLAVITNRNRVQAFHTRARLYLNDCGKAVRIAKSLLHPNLADATSVTHASYDEPWQQGDTLHHQVLAKAMLVDSHLDDIFAPVVPWWDALKSEARNGVLPGHQLDAIWQNSFTQAHGNRYVDLEWRWAVPISLKLLLIRSVYRFLVDARTYPTLSRELVGLRTKTVVLRVAALLGESLDANDFADFVDTEICLQAMVTGSSARSTRRHITLILSLPQAVIRNALRWRHWLRSTGHYAQRGVRLIRRTYHGVLWR